jgi:serine/threonine-protein kinase RsbW
MRGNSERGSATRREGPIERSLSDELERAQTCALPHESELHRVRARVAADLVSAGADPEPIFDCLVAVTEACSNALRHGMGSTAPRLSWVVEDDCARFLVQDFSGAPWRDPGGASRPPQQGESSERIGGFGLSLMRGLMDAVEIRVGAGGTLVELSKELR